MAIHVMFFRSLRVVDFFLIFFEIFFNSILQSELSLIFLFEFQQVKRNCFLSDVKLFYDLKCL